MSARAPLGSGNRQKPKLVIRAFKKPPSLPASFYESTSALLLNSSKAILKRTDDTSASTNASAKPISREELYRACESCVVHKFSERLYISLKDLLAQHLKTVAEDLEEKTKRTVKTEPQSLLLLLSHVVEKWNEHLDSLQSIRSIYLYLDRSYVLHHATHLQIWDLGVSLFREHVLPQPLLDLVTASVTTQAKLRWDGKAVNSDLLRSTSRMLSTLGLYHKSFLPPFLASATAYFAAEASAMTTNLKIREYLNHCTARLAEAHDTVTLHLDPSTRGPLVQLMEDSLIRPHVGTLLSQFHLLLGSDSAPQPPSGGSAAATDHLKTLYGFLGRVDGLEPMKAALEGYVKKQGGEIIKGSAEKEIVPELLVFRSAMDSVWKRSFSEWPAFKTAIKSAFEEACNDRTRLPELLAKFVDQLLRSTKSNETEAEAKLVEVMAVFRYLQNKDVFEAFYKSLLSKRLLLRKFSSMDLEKFFISELKTECGSAYTSKLEGMFKDMDLSTEITANYESHAADKFRDDELASKMNLWVLTTGYWPSYPAMPNVMLPADLVEHQKRFESYYSNKYQGRRVDWQHSLSSCHVEFNAPKGRKTLEVSELQALALVAFNGEEELSVLQIQEITGIDNAELVGVIQSLALGRVDKNKGTTRVLRRAKADQGNRSKEEKMSILSTDIFSVNLDFTNKQSRVKIPNISQRKEEAEQERQKADESIFRDRQHQIDAAVIRIMKSRKTLRHAELVSEVMGQLKFKAENKDVKGRVESLIEREYLERKGGGGPPAYNYLA